MVYLSSTNVSSTNVSSTNVSSTNVSSTNVSSTNVLFVFSNVQNGNVVGSLEDIMDLKNSGLTIGQIKAINK